MKNTIIILTILTVMATSAWAIPGQSNNSDLLAADKVSSVNPRTAAISSDILTPSQIRLKTMVQPDSPVITAVDCPAEAQIELEACGNDENGGCLMAPGTEAFESISCGVDVCGTYWSDDLTRDTDWYQLVIAEQGFVRWSAVGEAPTRIWMYDGSGGCESAVWLASISAGPDDTASVELELPAGTYWLVVGTDDWFDMPCDGSGDYTNNYVATVSCELGAPIFSVTPENIYGEALEGFSDTEILTVTNDGLGRLNFTAYAIQDIILQLSGDDNRIDPNEVDLPSLLAAERSDDIDDIYDKLPIKITDQPHDGPMVNLVDCPGEGIPEAEACGNDENGGCAMAPGTEAFESFSCNTTVCGTVWSDGSTRDTDWFSFDLTEPTLFTWTVTADFPLLTLIILPGSSGNGCGDYEALAIETAAPGDSAKIITSLPAGTYWVWVGPTAWYDMPCDGTGEYENDYVASLTCEPPWLSIDVVSGTIHESDGPVDINVLMDATDLLPGTYTGTIKFNSNDSGNSPLDVPVEFVVSKVFGYIPGDANMGSAVWPAELNGADVTYLVGYFRWMNQGCSFDGFYASAD
ncbi:MAG: hypothetical protein GY839_14595, partial [candidate division Zixibacteria bacterium]|nr:hypothetical protein [candidate division Zixibacteria bacterium]